MYLDLSSLISALTLRDLTDPARGAHAMQLLVDALVAACGARIVRASPVVTARDNYDRLY